MLRLEKRCGETTVRALVSIQNRTFHLSGRCGCFAAAEKNRSCAVGLRHNKTPLQQTAVNPVSTLHACYQWHNKTPRPSFPAVIVTVVTLPCHTLSFLYCSCQKDEREKPAKLPINSLSFYPRPPLGGHTHTHTHTLSLSLSLRL
jgi:hypothetical protein